MADNNGRMWHASFQPANKKDVWYFSFNYNDPTLTSWLQPSNDTKIKPCPEFEHRSGYKSIITQFDLVCSRYLLIATTQSAHLFGVLLGGIISTQLLQSISPRNLMLLGMYIQIACGCITGYITVYEMHTLFRCLSALFCAFMYTGGAVIMNDITGGKFKTVTICLFEQFWAIGVMLLPGLDMLTNSWSELYLALSLPTFALIFLHRWIPDSPRWLLKQGRIREAKACLEEAARCNGTEEHISSDFEHQLKSMSEAAAARPDPDPWWTIWREKAPVRNLILLHLAWGIFLTMYYGTLLNITAFGREQIHLNTVFAGASEMTGTFIGLCLIMLTKNKWQWCGLFNVVGGSVAYLAWLIPTDITNDDRVALLMGTAMVSKMSISCSLALLFTCTAELVETSKKSGAVYSCTIWGRTCFLVAPFIVATVKFGQLIPLTAFGSIVIVGGIIVLCIKEKPQAKTQRNSIYPETMLTSINRLPEKTADVFEHRF
ncbi:organic cation transporter protein-like isoform X2 [Armigeres subalbatus]|uniref:organic cation transporter protein-like isoform X2 n=1 Tax=Armigeres subalbatus TaxID=124917 RepID=UPI002ED608FF